jgi:hypothetical protein
VEAETVNPGSPAVAKNFSSISPPFLKRCRLFPGLLSPQMVPGFRAAVFNDAEEREKREQPEQPLQTGHTAVRTEQAQHSEETEKTQVSLFYMHLRTSLEAGAISFKADPFGQNDSNQFNQIPNECQG